MATQWYFKVGEKIQGPLTPEELLKKVRAGEIKSSTQVRKNDSPFFPAEEVNGLFETAFKNQPGKLHHWYETEHHGD
jgi:hypothetical protein